MTLRVCRMLTLVFIFAGLQGCASSRLTRDADEQAKAAYASGNAAVSDVGTLNPGRSWQGSSQAAKGIVIGGVAGGVTGGMISGIGVGPGLLGGMIFGGALGTWIDTHTTASDQLLNRGAEVMVLGDQIRVVLLTKDVFEEHSANISVHAYKTLDQVVQLIGRYPNRQVTVAVFSDPGDSPKASLILTDAEARAVTRYLWRSGVNTRVLYAAGMGITNPVARPGGDHPGDNSRVEITLERLPV